MSTTVCALASTPTAAMHGTRNSNTLQHQHDPERPHISPRLLEGMVMYYTNYTQGLIRGCISCFHHLISSRLVFAKGGTCSHWMWRTCQDHDQPKQGPICFPSNRMRITNHVNVRFRGPRAHLYEALTKVTHVEYLFCPCILINWRNMPSTPFPVAPRAGLLMTSLLLYMSTMLANEVFLGSQASTSSFQYGQNLFWMAVYSHRFVCTLNSRFGQESSRG